MPNQLGTIALVLSTAVSLSALTWAIVTFVVMRRDRESTRKLQVAQTESENAKVELTREQQADGIIAGLNTLLTQTQMSAKNLRLELAIAQKREQDKDRQIAELMERNGVLYADLYEYRKRLGGSGPANVLREEQEPRGHD